MGKLAEQAIARLSELLGSSPGYGAIQNLSAAERADLNTLYAALHKARRFDLLRVHAVPWIEAKLREKYQASWYKFTGSAYLRIVKSNIVERWNPDNPDNSEFGTWIGQNAWSGASDAYKKEQRADLVQGMKGVDKTTREYRESVLRGEIPDELATEIRSELGESIQKFAADDAWQWAEEFVPDGDPAATERDLHLYNCLLNDKDLQRGRRQQRIIDLIGDGMDQPAIASLLGKSLRTIQGDYNYIRKYIGREHGSVTDVREFASRIRNKRDPAEGRRLFQERETARIERQKAAAEAQLFGKKPVLSPTSSRPVIRPKITYRKRRSTPAPAWLAVYHELRRSHPLLALNQKDIARYSANCRFPTKKRPTLLRTSHDRRHRHRCRSGTPRMIGPTRHSLAGGMHSCYCCRHRGRRSLSNGLRRPEDMRPDPEAARRLSESLKGWQKSKHGHGGSRPAPAVEA